jgi:hypothetical protein
MKVWVVTGTSESGDGYGPFAFASKPTKAQLKKICAADAGDGNGPGDFGSWIYLTVSAVAVQRGVR